MTKDLSIASAKASAAKAQRERHAPSCAVPSKAQRERHAPSCAGASKVRWILVEHCPDLTHRPEFRTCGEGMVPDMVHALLARMEQPFLQGGGGVAAMLQPAGPYPGAVVEVRLSSGECLPQIIGWGGIDDVETLLARNTALLRDLAPRPSTGASAFYFFATRS